MALVFRVDTRLGVQVDFQALLAVNSDAALNFFHTNLKGLVGLDARKDETLYVASVLANYAQTSRFERTSLPVMANLSEVFDNFVVNKSFMADPGTLEIAGAQTLLLSGFFRQQMRRRHNVNWYDRLGSGFFEQVSERSKEDSRQEFFSQLALRFPFWTLTCSELENHLRERRLLLRLS
ncbi:MAG: hypothetical protein NUV78_03110 [Candidatus Zambryskibacteria bacterium]|nr:hypothetical protein [Candidatus Zambryskibacteria bacterium]